MSLLETRSRLKLYENGEEVYPLFSELIESTGFTVGFNKLTVSALASNEALEIGSLGSLRQLELRLANFNDVDKITLKVNGNTVADPLNPVALYTESSLSSITASNSSTAAVDILWRAINT
jgi:hypothetical protein